MLSQRVWKVICEPEGYSEQTLYQVTDILDKEITDFLEEYRNYSEESFEKAIREISAGENQRAQAMKSRML